MLYRLTVSNFAVVEKAEVEFSPSLTVITGETGAGKSVLIGALDLVLGGRADSSVVRDGAKEAEVEADFGDTVVRRTVTREGRSRAWVDDESVSIAELKELGRTLLDIHGPTANQKLMEEAFQRETLDDCGNIDFGDYAKAWSERAELVAQRSALLGAASEDEKDGLRFQVNELEEAGLTEDDETIAERHAAAAHAGEIVENANAITEALGGDQSVAEILLRLQPRFREMAKHLPSAADLSAAAEELVVKVQELSRTVADAASRIDVREEDLDLLDRRLTLVNRLLRKYRVFQVSDLMSLLESKKTRLEELEHREERLKDLESKIAVADEAVRVAGAELTKRRTATAKRLSKAVTEELRDLGFLQAKFFVELEPIEPEMYGTDRVVYMFEPNPGEAARPLADIASSGEIARVMLAIKSTVAFGSGTLVFDEIDANIGGEIGAVVGEKLRKVAATRQVVAITHLPQSAVFGEKHLVVSKSVIGGRTFSTIAEARGEERILEIERMLGGENLTSVTRKHAEELLGLSR